MAVQGISQQLLVYTNLYQQGADIKLLQAGGRLLERAIWVLDTGVVGTKFCFFFDEESIADVNPGDRPILPAIPILADERKEILFPGAGLQLKKGLVMAFSSTSLLYTADAGATGAFGALVV